MKRAVLTLLQFPILGFYVRRVFYLLVWGGCSLVFMIPGLGVLGIMALLPGSSETDIGAALLCAAMGLMGLGGVVGFFVTLWLVIRIGAWLRSG